MRFLTLSEKQLLQEYLQIKEPHVLISISNPNCIVKITNIPSCKGILKLKFQDIETIDEKSVFFDHGMARTLLDFINETVDRINLIVVHCGAGVSRSVAVASALSKIINNCDDYIFSKSSPNMLVYISILDCYFTEDKWNRITYLRDKSLKESLNPAIYRLISHKLKKRGKNE